MNPYIKEFKYETETFELDSVYQLNEVYAVNKENTNFTIFHQNIRSVNKNIDEFKILLRQVSTNIDCIILTETWKIENIDIYKMPNYEIIYNNGCFNKSDGVIVYIRNNIKYTYNIIVKNGVHVIEMVLNLNNRKIKIFPIYRSPASCILTFNNDIKALLENSHKNYDYTILIGDLNIDILENKEYTNDYLNILSENAFISAVNCVTRKSGQEGSCIDHAFIKSPTELDFVIPMVIKTNITDHYTTALQIIFPEKQNIPNLKPRYRNILNMDKFSEILSQKDWSELYQCENAESATEYFVNFLQNEINKCTSKIKIKRINKKRKDWITDGLVKSVNTKNIYQKQLLKNPHDKDLERKYKNYRNKLNSVIKTAKTNFYRSQIEQRPYDSKTLWSVVNQATNNSFSGNKQVNNIRSETGEIIENDVEISNSFNDYFTGIGEKLASKINKNKIPKVKRKSYHKTMFIVPADKNEVIREIKTLKNKKASGLDGLTAEILKTVQKQIAEPLTFIINKIIITGECPTHFKKSVVKPIFKKGDEMEIGNYRPISLISNLSKIFEKILKNRITTYIKKNSLLSKCQFGFQEGLSTQDAINILSQNIYRSLDNGSKSLCVFIDIQKAFDTVSHTQLLEKLEDIGIRGICLELIKSYLVGRKQCVQINNTISNFQDITCGVPQGTVLGPVLFNIYKRLA